MMKYNSIVIGVLLLLVLMVNISAAVELQILVIGHGYVQGESFACGDNCTKTFDKGTVVHVKAIPFPDSRFAGWKIGGKPHEGVITLEEDTVLSAIFERHDDPMLADGTVVYWYTGSGGRDYGKIMTEYIYVTFTDREQWGGDTDDEYHQAIQQIAQTFHPEAEIVSRTQYTITVKSPEALDKELWFDRLMALQELNTVLWAGPIVSLRVDGAGQTTSVWNEMSVYFPESYTEEQIIRIEDEYDLQRLDSLLTPNSFIYQVGSPLEAIETANHLYESGIVESATPSIAYPEEPTSEPPNDEYSRFQWHLYSQTGEDINVLPAWELTKG